MEYGDPAPSLQTLHFGIYHRKGDPAPIRSPKQHKTATKFAACGAGSPHGISICFGLNCENGAGSPYST